MVSKRSRCSPAEAFVDKAELGKLLLESTGEAICASDMLGNYTFCNSAPCDCYGTRTQSISSVRVCTTQCIILARMEHLTQVGLLPGGAYRTSGLYAIEFERGLVPP